MHVVKIIFNKYCLPINCFYFVFDICEMNFIFCLMFYKIPLIICIVVQCFLSCVLQNPKRFREPMPRFSEEFGKFHSVTLNKMDLEVKYSFISYINTNFCQLLFLILIQKCEHRFFFLKF